MPFARTKVLTTLIAVAVLVAATAAGGVDAASHVGRAQAKGGHSSPRGASRHSVANRVAVVKARHRRPAPVAAPPPAPVAAPPAAPTEPPGLLIFGSTFDGSFSPWLDVQSLASRATISTAHPFQGSGAGRFEVRPGDVEPQTGGQRSEVSGPTFSAGESIYIRDQIRVPSGYSYQGPWQLINQLHETYWGGSPGIATFLDPSRRISVAAGDGDPQYWSGPQLESERWYDLVYHVFLSRSASQGFVEVWLDGVQQKLVNGSTRMYGETIQASQTYLKVGVFRADGSSGVSVIEHDDVAAGTSLAVVQAF